MKAVKKRWVILGISLFVVLAVFFTAMGMSGVFTNEEVEDAEITEDLIQPIDKASGKINVLLLGVDVDGLRTDTIIVASYDLDNNKVNMLSIPRDTRMYIGSRYQKINAAHAITQKGKIKGPQGSIDAVTRLTGIPINYYVEFNFNTFRDVIDALGGVDFDVPRNMFYEDPVQKLRINLKKGQQHLDGDKSEQLVRFRSYPEGDIARVRTQQEFLKAVAQQKLNSSIIKRIPDLFTTFNENIETNFTMVDILKYLPNLEELSSENIFMHQLPGNYNDTDYGASYWICDMTKAKKIIVEDFGYNDPKMTIHSSDGKSTSKDVKNVKTTSSPTTKPEATHSTSAPSSTSKPSTSPSATNSPSQSTKPSTTPKTTISPIATSEPTSVPTSGDNNTNKPTPSETKKPESTTKPIQTLKPIDDNITRPTANPTTPNVSGSSSDE